MKHSYVLCALGLAALTWYGCGNNNKNKKITGTTVQQENFILDPDGLEIIYPKTKTVEASDTFFGNVVQDPYRWLEGNNPADSTDLQNWIIAQSKLAEEYFKAVPIRQKIADRLREIWNYEKFGTPFRKGDNYYFYKNDGMQNQSVLYQAADLKNATPKVFLDPNTLAEDGTKALNYTEFSSDGKYMAYSVSSGGSDWQTIFVRATDSGKDLSDSIAWARYSGVSWYKDGFFYSRFAEVADNEDKYTQKNEFQQVYYHKLGTPQAQDELIYADRTNPQRMYGAQATEDGRFLILFVSETTSGNAVYIQRLDVQDADFEPLVTNFDHDFEYVDNEGDKFLFYTNLNAPNYQVMEFDLKGKVVKGQAQVTSRSIIAQNPNAVLSKVQMANGQFLVTYLQNATEHLKLFDRAGKLVQDIELPKVNGKPIGGVIGALNSKKTDTKAYYSFSSFVYPPTIFELDLATRKSTIWRQAKVNFNPEEFVTEQHFYPSKDGTQVPIWVIYKKGLALNGANPTLLYGYGGFNISILPNFALERIPFLEYGGVFAVANIRGGGEFGKKWHDGGRQLHKQNVFDDFIAAAEWLIAQKYTSKSKLAIEGRSNGGLLVGACMTQRPDLFKVAVPIVGVLDMLRYHQFTVGGAWATDYGTSAEATHFQNLIKYSPLHNVRKTNYPATLIMTAEYDDRVVPAHSFKFGATVQHLNTSNHPILLRIDRKAGHGAGKPTEKLIAEVADKLSFILFNLGLK